LLDSEIRKPLLANEGEISLEIVLVTSVDLMVMTDCNSEAISMAAP
jgi:hypothetical protein